MTDWLDSLQRDLDQRDAASLRRSLRAATVDGKWLRIDGRRLLNLASNDYLALSQHPRLIAAAQQAVGERGVGSGASRLVAGHSPSIAALEARFAKFKHAEAALLFPTGYMANLAVLSTLAGGLSGRGDLICLDKLNHASLVDAARLAERGHAGGGATVRIFPHRNLDKLERLLSRFREDASPRSSRHGVDEADNGEAEAARPPRAFIVTDSVFSMDGDTADLPALCDLADRYDAVLVIDEAHGTGVLGQTGAGLAEAMGVADRVDITISTASKALGGLGGVVTAKRVVIDTLINHARTFIYTTGAPPAQVAAIDAALDVLEAEPQRRQRLAAITTQWREALGISKDDVAARNDAPPIATPILPLHVGDADKALALSRQLFDRGFFVPAIRPPTVAAGTARLRISLRADLDDADLSRFEVALEAARVGD